LGAGQVPHQDEQEQGSEKNWRQAAQPVPSQGGRLLHAAQAGLRDGGAPYEPQAGGGMYSASKNMTPSRRLSVLRGPTSLGTNVGVRIEMDFSPGELPRRTATACTV